MSEIEILNFRIKSEESLMIDGLCRVSYYQSKNWKACDFPM